MCKFLQLESLKVNFRFKLNIPDDVTKQSGLVIRMNVTYDYNKEIYVTSFYFLIYFKIASKEVVFLIKRDNHRL